MMVELVRTTTADQLRLDGALLAPPESSRPSIALDGIICLAGVGGNFYGSTLLEEITPTLLQLGVPVLWVNTRGRDGVHTASFGGRRRRQGSAYESVDECRLDVTAWVDFLVERGCRRVGLFGHSLGAIKSVYSQAYEPHSGVACIVAASPPRLSCACFREGPQSPVFLETLATAEQHVAAGNPDTLIEASFPFPLLITAAGFIDKYGPAERYNIVRFARLVRVPLLFVYGSEELASGGVAFAGVPEALAASGAGQQFAFVNLPGADHMYTGARDALAREVAAWLRATLPRVD